MRLESSITMRTPLLLSALIVAVGCATQAGRQFADEGTAQGATAQLELDLPARGFQVETLGVMIEPGEDIRWCEAVQLPGGPDTIYPVGRIEAAMTAHGQDLIVNAAVLGGDAAAIMEPGSRVPCTRAGEAFGEDLSEITSTQQPYHDQRFPEGVGQVFRGGQMVAVDYHYVNDSRERVAAKVKLNFHVIDQDAVQRVARTAGFHNLTIYTPPWGRSSHLGECRVGSELLVGEIVRRTQVRGTEFSVWRAGGDRDGELIWESRDPSDSRLEFGEPIHLSPGEGFRFECNYENTTDLELRFGVNGSDEMCTLNALYWQPDGAPADVAEGCLLLEVGKDGVARW
jgi:hypothetical protein